MSRTVLVGQRVQAKMGLYDMGQQQGTYQHYGKCLQFSVHKRYRNLVQICVINTTSFSLVLPNVLMSSSLTLPSSDSLSHSGDTQDVWGTPDPHKLQRPAPKVTPNKYTMRVKMVCLLCKHSSRLFPDSPTLHVKSPPKPLSLLHKVWSDHWGLSYWFSLIILPQVSMWTSFPPLKIILMPTQESCLCICSRSNHVHVFVCPQTLLKAVPRAPCLSPLWYLPQEEDLVIPFGACSHKYKWRA